MKKKCIYLILEDGTWYRGDAIGSIKEDKLGEVVFNTSMSGYQEIITDPSYKGQIVIFTYPSIGNYGINEEDYESDKPYLSGIIMRDYCEIPSNFRSKMTLDDFLKKYKVPGINGIDTRALVRKIRSKGSMNGGIFHEKYSEEKKPAEFKRWIQEKVKEVSNLPTMEGKNLTDEFNGSHSSAFIEEYSNGKTFKAKIGVLDFGIKNSILKYLIDAGLQPVLFPGNTPMQKWKNYSENEMDGFFLSNGPGDPAAVTNGIKNIEAIVQKGKPVFGICLGHQMLTHALGAKTYKMKFGHHGGNQPVKLKNNQKVIITAQNHGFAAETQSLDQLNLEYDHNPNDESVEGFFQTKSNILSVQYHPEASPGPHDALYIFHEFKEMVLKAKGA